MKFSCTKDNLAKALSLAERFVGKNVTLPILGNVLLEVRGNNLLISATNLEHAVYLSVVGHGSRDGKISIPAKILSSLLQSSKENKLDLEEKQGNLFLRTEARDVRLNGLPPDEFPPVPKIKKTGVFFMDAASLCEGITRVLPAASTSEFKPELAGIFFRSSAGALQLAATDTFRLAETTLNLEGKTEGEDPVFILPYRLSQELPRVYGESGGVVKVTLGDGQVLFEGEGIKVVSRLIDGTYPEYSAIIPKSFATTSHLKRDEFLDAIRASSIFTSKLQEVNLDFHDRELGVRSANPEVGEYKTALKAATTGRGLKLSFNYRYLLDGLNALHEEEIFVGMGSENSPVLLRDKTDDTFLYILMPIRI